MSISTPEFLGELDRAAIAAQQDELEFRKSVAEGIARRERARQFAFRRLDLARTMLTAARSAESEQDAVKRQIAALKSEFGWHSDTGARPRIYAAWEPVALAIWRSLPAKDGVTKDTSRASVGEAMLAFEAWYQAEAGHPFLALLDHEIPEMPVVEF